MASGMTPAKRFAVRTALVAGSTLATVWGAQSLILLDSTNSTLNTTSAALSITTTANSSTTSVDSQIASSTITTIREASDDDSSLSLISQVPTSQTVQQYSVPSVPSTHSSR